MICQAEVTTSTSRQTYIDLCDPTFKLRYRNHVCSFKNERYKHATELSKHVRGLKNKNILCNIKWWKAKQARCRKRCYLCLCEKYFIICKLVMSTLSNRNELISNCRHSKKFLLKIVLAQFYQSHLCMSRHKALFFIFTFFYVFVMLPDDCFERRMNLCVAITVI